MTKTAVGLASGLAFVVLTMIAVAVINLPQAEGAFSAERNPSIECPLLPVAQDQGYGVTGTVVRHVCGAAQGN